MAKTNSISKCNKEKNMSVNMTISRAVKGMKTIIIDIQCYEQ